MKNPLLLVIFSIVTAYCFQSSPAMAQESIYENKKEGVRMKYSHDWAKREQDSGIVATFLSPAEGGGDDFVENVTVMVQPRMQAMTLSGYTELLLGQLKQMEDFWQVEIKDRTLARTPAKEIVYMGREGTFGAMMQYRQVWAMRGNKAYLITYKAERSDYNRFYNGADVVFDSFEFI